MSSTLIASECVNGQQNGAVCVYDNLFMDQQTLVWTDKINCRLGVKVKTVEGLDP